MIRFWLKPDSTIHIFLLFATLGWWMIPWLIIADYYKQKGYADL